MPVLKTSFSEGDLIAGNYRVLSIAGSGGMGVVYRARDQRLDRTVALKFLPPELNASDREKDRFLREARTASSLDHPNIGVIHGIEETAEGLTFIVMAFYEGSSLAQRIRKGPFKVREAMGIARQMAQGLGDAHAHGIVHRDVKPSNVMLTASGLVKIVDFGLARAMTEQTASQTGVTGTVRYMSPEQAMDRAVDQRCDIWALGVVFGEMLTGSTPFHAESITAMLFSILNEPPKGLEGVHPALQPILYRALAKDPERRYESCAEFLADLNDGGKADSSGRGGRRCDAETAFERTRQPHQRAYEAANRRGFARSLGTNGKEGFRAVRTGCLVGWLFCWLSGRCARIHRASARKASGAGDGCALRKACCRIALR